MSDRCKITADEAIGLLPDGEYLHTTICNGMWLGADWTRDAVIDHITKAGGAHLAGPMATGSGHGICLDPSRRLFVVHDPAKLAALNAAIAKE